jgi:hypothetical protein
MTKNPRKRVFRSNPDPDQLRKQIKARLAYMKTRVPGARSADVKFILAREYGFASWAALQAEIFRRIVVGKIRLFRRAWIAAVTPKNRVDQDAGEAHMAFLRTGVAVQNGFIFAALVGVGMVFMTGAQMHALRAMLERLSVLF